MCAWDCINKWSKDKVFLQGYLLCSSFLLQPLNKTLPLSFYCQWLVLFLSFSVQRSEGCAVFYNNLISWIGFLSDRLLIPSLYLHPLIHPPTHPPSPLFLCFALLSFMFSSPLSILSVRPHCKWTERDRTKIWKTPQIPLCALKGFYRHAILNACDIMLEWRLTN